MCLAPCSGRSRGRLRPLLAEFGHDLCDVNGGVGRHLGPLLLLLLSEDDWAETGPSVLGVVLQLGIAVRPEDLIRSAYGQKNLEEDKRENRGQRSWRKRHFCTWYCMKKVEKKG